MTHKRLSEARSANFKRPRRECLACYDSGILSDADGLLSALLQDYDRLPDGRRFAGSDLALICHCQAAYPGTAKDGSTKRGGLRLSSGSLAVIETERGQQPIGAELSIDATRQLQRQRRQAWDTTERQMTDARALAATGQTAVLEAMANARAILRPVDPASTSQVQSSEVFPW